MVLNLLRHHHHDKYINVLVIVYSNIVSNISWMKSGGERVIESERRRNYDKQRGCPDKKHISPNTGNNSNMILSSERLREEEGESGEDPNTYSPDPNPSLRKKPDLGLAAI